MCNLHDEVPKEDLERYVRKHLRELWLPGLDPSYAAKPVAHSGLGSFLWLDMSMTLIRQVQSGKLTTRNHTPRYSQSFSIGKVGII